MLTNSTTTYPIQLRILIDLNWENRERLNELLNYRKLAHTALEKVLHDNSIKSEIRIWPHHFDTGAFGSLPGRPGASVGFGLAIPDSLVDDYYFYISGYKGHDSLDVGDFDPLSVGGWESTNFNGGLLPIKGVDEAQATNFFNEAITQYNKTK